MKNATLAPQARVASTVAAILIAVIAVAYADAPADLQKNSNLTTALRSKVKNIVVIYAENRAFDNLFGNFPGAHGLSEVVDADGTPLAAYRPQRDRDGRVLSTLPQTWGGVTAAGVMPVVTQAQSAGLPNAPFSVEHAFTANSGSILSTATTTRDLYHRFFEHQMQIDGGANDGFAAWSDAGGLTMGHFDYSHSALYRLAQTYTLADDFFQGAFGGSFLNHQYLICACAPEYPSADARAGGAAPSIAVLDTDADGRYLPKLSVASTSAVSVIDGPPVFVNSGNIAPANYFGDHRFYAVNTMQPPYQPSGNKPRDADGNDLLFADPDAATTLPPQTQQTIGDILSNAAIDWKWYAGSWNSAVLDGTQDPSKTRKAIYSPSSAGGAPDFQTHHAPFNYYARFDPVAHAAERAAHLQDYGDLLADAAAGTLPPVAFFKPQGNLNLHAGYANLEDGDTHIAGLVRRLQSSPQWPNMVIVITFDEFGGVWDQVSPPRGDLLGPGTRIPAIVISPLARTGYVDHTPYDTGSINRLISRRFDLPMLTGLTQRDAALVAHGAPPMGDLTHALVLQRAFPNVLSASGDTFLPGRVRLTFATVGDAHAYQVFVGTATGEESAPPRKILRATDTRAIRTVTVSGLNPGQVYYFKVAAVLTNDEATAYSNEAHASPHRGLRW